jgi:transposase-like protein
MTLALLGNTLLRTAITRNLVTFPAQIQPFLKRTTGDQQERIVQLYFVRGWSVRNICDRYGMSKAMIHKLLAEWRIRAVESGYIQEIEPDCLSALQPEAESGSDTPEMNGAKDNEAVSGTAESNDCRFDPVVVKHPHTIPEPAHLIYPGPLPAPMPASESTVALSAGRSV